MSTAHAFWRYDDFPSGVLWRGQNQRREVYVSGRDRWEEAKHLLTIRGSEVSEWNFRDGRFLRNRTNGEPLDVLTASGGWAGAARGLGGACPTTARGPGATSGLEILAKNNPQRDNDSTRFWCKTTNVEPGLACGICGHFLQIAPDRMS